jgi:uncharacterized membrane protein YdjX (TVP38/TMEM64 family)
MRPAVRAGVVLTLLVAGAILLRLQYPGALDLKTVRAFVEGWGPLAYLAAYVVLTTLQVPASLMNIVASVAFGFGPGWALAMAGQNIAASVQYFIGKAIGIERLRALLKGRGLERVERNGTVAVIVLRYIPIPYLWVNLGCGALNVPWPRYAIGTLVGLVVQITVLTFLGAQLAEGAEGVHTRALLGMLAGGVLLLGVGLFSRWVRNRFAPPA